MVLTIHTYYSNVFLIVKCVQQLFPYFVLITR